ncbi:MAG TPA: hypothetical protein VLQ67_11475 [Arachnia sp.]|nr:hypothetical protein [Arachnia sp.]
MSIPAHSWTSHEAGAVGLLLVAVGIGGRVEAGAGVDVLGAGGLEDVLGVGVAVLAAVLVAGGMGVVGRVSAGVVVGDSTGADGVGVRDAGGAEVVWLEGVGVGPAGMSGGTPQLTSARATIKSPAAPGLARWWTGPHRSSDRRIVPASLLTFTVLPPGGPEPGSGLSGK